MVRGADGSDVRRGAETEHTGRQTRAEEQQVQHHQQRHASYHANQTGENSVKGSFTLSESEFFSSIFVAAQCGDQIEFSMEARSLLLSRQYERTRKVHLY